MTVSLHVQNVMENIIYVLIVSLGINITETTNVSYNVNSLAKHALHLHSV